MRAFRNEQFPAFYFRRTVPYITCFGRNIHVRGRPDGSNRVLGQIRGSHVKFRIIYNVQTAIRLVSIAFEENFVGRRAHRLVGHILFDRCGHHSMFTKKKPLTIALRRYRYVLSLVKLT